MSHCSKFARPLAQGVFRVSPNLHSIFIFLLVGGAHDPKLGRPKRAGDTFSHFFRCPFFDCFLDLLFSTTSRPNDDLGSIWGSLLASFSLFSRFLSPFSGSRFRNDFGTDFHGFYLHFWQFSGPLFSTTLQLRCKMLRNGNMLIWHAGAVISMILEKCLSVNSLFFCCFFVFFLDFSEHVKRIDFCPILAPKIDEKWGKNQWKMNSKPGPENSKPKNYNKNVFGRILVENGLQNGPQNRPKSYEQVPGGSLYVPFRSHFGPRGTPGSLFHRFWDHFWPILCHFW